MNEGRRSHEPQPIVPALPVSAPWPARLARAFVRIGHGLWVHNATDAASSMAFNFFLSLVPLLIMVGFVLGNFVRKRGVDAFIGPVLDTVPPTSAEIIRHELERLAGGSTASVAPIGIAGFLWLTSNGTHHVMDVFERAVLAQKRSWLKQRLIALGTVVGGLLVICATTGGLLEIDNLLHHHQPLVAVRALEPGETNPAVQIRPARDPDKDLAQPHRVEKKKLMARPHAEWEHLVALGAMLSVTLCALAAFYRYAVEHPPAVRRRYWPGACVALSAWLAVSWAFGNYVISLGKYALFYGGLAAVAVLMVWLYLTSLSLLLGAEVNAQLEGVRE